LPSPKIAAAVPGLVRLSQTTPIRAIDDLYTACSLNRRWAGQEEIVEVVESVGMVDHDVAVGVEERGIRRVSRRPVGAGEPGRGALKQKNQQVGNIGQVQSSIPVVVLKITLPPVPESAV
jgi:hypothetical protein